MVIYIRTEFAEVVEWQTRRTQNPLRDDLVRVQVPPSAPIFLAPAYPDRRFVYTLRKAVFVCFLRERRSARNRSPSLLHLKSGKNVNFSLPIRLERG